MTLILSCLMPEFVLQVCDRRLSDLAGRVVDDNSTKMVFYNGHLVFSFTGIAAIPTPSGAIKGTDEFIRDTLANKATGNVEDAVRHLAERLSTALKCVRINDRTPHLAVCGCGWVQIHNGNTFLPVRVLVSNFHDDVGRRTPSTTSSFIVYFATVLPCSIYRWFADGQFVSNGLLNSLNRRVRRLGPRVSGQVALRSAAQAIRDVANSNRFVGRTLLSFYLPKDSVVPGRVLFSGGLPSGTSASFLYLREDDDRGIHWGPHTVAFGLTAHAPRFGPADRDGVVRLRKTVQADE